MAQAGANEHWGGIAIKVCREKNEMKKGATAKAAF